MEIIFGIVRWVVIIALLGVVLFRIFRIIRPFETGLVERLGKFHREAKSGLNIVIPGLERIIISEDYTINGQKCFKEHANEKEPVKDGHRMDHATCFQYYNPKILDYISSRI